MSLAQRRTTPDGIEPVPIPQDAPFEAGQTADESNDYLAVDSERRASATSNNHRASIVGIPVEDGKEVWQELSYDAFHAPQGPQDLLHYEPFPPEVGENVAAYEVSAAKRIGKSDLLLFKNEPKSSKTDRREADL